MQHKRRRFPWKILAVLAAGALLGGIWVLMGMEAPASTHPIEKQLDAALFIPTAKQ